MTEEQEQMSLVLKNISEGMSLIADSMADLADLIVGRDIYEDDENES